MPEYDTVFSLPSVDEDPDTELGVLLMGLGPERLLAGLGVAEADPVAAFLLVDQLRHDARPRLAAADPEPGVRSAALRRLWAAALRAVGNAGLSCGHGERVFLAACWLRRAEIDQLSEAARGAPGIAP